MLSLEWKKSNRETQLLLIIHWNIICKKTGIFTQNDINIFRMSKSQQNQLFSSLENSACTCGCGMTIGQCLRDDPTCPVSPELAQNTIQAIINGETNNSSETAPPRRQDYWQITQINSSQNGSVVSGQIDGQNCTYASAGGMTIKTCD